MSSAREEEPTAKRSTWASLRPGDLVVDKKGHEWMYVGKTGKIVALIDLDRKPFTFTPDPDASVTVIERAVPPTSMDDCIETVKTRLGGFVIASEAGGELTVPLVADMPHRMVLLTHMQMLHGDGMEASRLGKRDLKELHDMGHLPAAKRTAHEHVAGFYARQS